MKVLSCNQPVYFDVDDTLVMWGRAKPHAEGAVQITCPTSRYRRAADELGAETDELICEQGEWFEWLIPHKKHIEQMKLHKLRGHTIIVWSAGGWEWAHAVVVALKLEQYVDLVLEKPMWFYDDRKPEDFMGKPLWYPDDSGTE